MDYHDKRDIRKVNIFSMKMAGYLMIRGFSVIDIKNNTFLNDGKKVFIFNESYELKTAMREYNDHKLKILDIIKK